MEKKKANDSTYTVLCSDLPVLHISKTGVIKTKKNFRQGWRYNALDTCLALCVLKLFRKSEHSFSFFLSDRHLKLGLADWLDTPQVEWVCKHPGQVVLTVVSVCVCVFTGACVCGCVSVCVCVCMYMCGCGIYPRVCMYACLRACVCQCRHEFMCQIERGMVVSSACFSLSSTIHICPAYWLLPRRRHCFT